MDQRVNFHQHLQETKDDVLFMGSMVIIAINGSVEALVKRDLARAHRIIEDDSNINKKRFEIEDKCIELITKQQPVAKDLREIIAILNIVTELERIGDYAEGIAKIVIMIGNEPPLKPLVDIPRMSEITVEMIQKSMKAFVESDVKAAAEVASMDNSVDGLYDQVFRELLTFMMSDPKTINRATRLIWVAHNLERVADRVTNICERIVYTNTGKMEETEASKY